MPVDLSDFEPLTEAKPGLDLSDFEPIDLAPPAQSAAPTVELGPQQFTEPFKTVGGVEIGAFREPITQPQEIVLPDAVPTPAGLGPELAPVAGAGTVGELLKTAKEAVSTPPWQGFGVEKIPASIILPGGAAVDLLFNSLGDSKAAQVIQGLHKAGNNQIENMANFMGSPLGVAMMGIGSLGPAAQRIVSLAFAGDMASSQPELWSRFQQATTLREKTETLADAVAGLGLTLTALKHGLTKAEKTTPAEPPPLPSPTPLTDAALGETSTRIQPQQETPNATETQRIGQSVRPEPQGGTQGGAPAEAGVGDSLQRAETGAAQAEVVPTKEPAPVVQTGEAQVPVPPPAAEGQAEGAASSETPAPSFAAKFNKDTFLQIPAWVEPGSKFDKVLGELRERNDPFHSVDVQGIWKSLTPEQRQDLAARGWVVGTERDPNVVALHVSNDAVAARKYFGAQNRIAARKLAETQLPPKEVTPSEKEVQGREGQVAAEPPIPPSVQPAGETAGESAGQIIPSGKAFAPKAVELLKQADRDMAANPNVRGPSGKSHARQINEYASGRDPEVARATHGDVTVIVTQSGQQFAEHVNLPGFPVPIGNDVAIRWSPAIKTKYGVTKKQFDSMPLAQQAEIIAEHFASIKSGGSSPPIISYLAHQIAQTYFPKESLEYWNKRGFTWGDKGAYGKARAREWEDFLFSRGLDLSGAQIKNAPAPPTAIPSAAPEAAPSKPAAPAEGAPSAPAAAAAPMTHREFINAGHIEAEWDVYAAERNAESRARNQAALVESWRSGKANGNDIANLLRGRGVPIPESIAHALQHDDTTVSRTEVSGRGMKRPEAQKIHKWVSEQMNREFPETATPAAAPEVPAGNVAETYPNTPKEIIRKAKSNLEAGDLPTELRLYSEEERAGIAKDLGVTDTSPEALSEALIDKFAVNRTEKPSPYPPGDLREKPPSEIDELIKADEGNDWTEATGPAEIPITPKPSRQAMGITPSGSSAIGKVLVAAKDFGKRIKQAIVDIAEFSDFRKSLLNWSARGQKSSDEIMRAYKEIKLSVPNPERREAITNWIQAGGDDALLASRAAASPNIARRRGYELARTLTPEELAVAQKVRDTFDILRRRAEKYGIEINEIENYVTQIWKRPPREFWPSSGNRLSGAVRFAKARTFESFFAGEQAGWKPQTKDISKLLPIYMNEINNAINARQFVADLVSGVASDGRPLLAPSGIVKTIEEPDARRYLVLPEIKPSEASDYKRLDGHPALHSWRWRAADENGNPIFVYGDLAIHPEAFSHLKNVLGQSALREWWRSPSETAFGQIPKSVAKFLIDDVQQVAKATMLGFFSPFHLVQEGTHGIGHKVNPFYNIPKIDMRDPGQMDAARHSLMLQPDRISAAHFKEGLDGHSRNLAAKLAGKIPGIGKYVENWSEQFQQWLFHQYIPGLKYKTYQHIYERNLKRYADQLTAGKVSDDQVKYLSAQQANAAYGHLNYADMGRNPTIQHIMQTFLLAPDFLEARGRFAAQAAKGLVAKSGREQAVAMATLAGTFWVAARILNQLADKDPHWDKPFEVVVGNRRYRMRSVPEDIYMAVKDTRSFSYGRLSPLIGRGTIEGFSGVNYRGEPTSFGETLTNIVGGMIPLSVQPMTRGLTETGKDNPVSPFEQFMGSIGLHVSRYSPVSETYKLAGKWLDKNAEAYGIDKRKGVYPRSKYVALRNALDDGDFDKAKAEIEKLKASEKVENYQLRQRFAESVNHPFTGSNKTDDIFRKSLDERGKAMFDSAKKRRGLLLERFDLAKERPR